MKRIYLVLLSMVILTGCFGKEESSVNKDDNSYQFQEEYKYIKKVDGYKTNNIRIINNSNMDFDVDEMYGFYQKDKMIYYLDFVNYIENFEKMFDKDTKFVYDSKNETWTASLEEYKLVLDFKENKIVFDDVNVIDSLFKSGDSGEKIMETYDKLYKDGKFKTVEESKKLVVDLDNYNMELVREDDAFLVPAHLLQFILSAYDYKLYYNGKNYYYKDVFGDETYSVIESRYELNENEYAYAHQFNKLIFDNFYGLKELHPTLIEDLEQTSDISGFSNNYREFISDLDDGHTSILNFMYTGDSEPTNKEFEKLMDSFAEIRRVGCYESFDEGSDDFNIVRASDKTAILEIHSLSSDNFAEEYFKKIESIKDYENIVLDIRCNGGGYLFNSYVLFYPFSNDAIITSTGDIYGGLYNELIIKKEKEIVSDANLYIMTSDFTFSAANYATSIAKDNGFAKIIGENSGGGTAAVGTYSSPNGAVMMFSSGSSLLYNNDFELIENGIDVDISYTFKNDQPEYIKGEFTVSNMYYQDIATLVESIK